MEKLKIVFDIPNEILSGLETGKYLRKGGVIVNSQNHQVVTWLNEIAMNKFFSPSSLGINPATFALTLAVSAGFIVMNSKLNKIQKQLNNIKKDLSEIREIVSDTQAYEVGRFFADFQTYLQEAQFLTIENKSEKLSTLRLQFLKIGNFLITMIVIKWNMN